VAMKVEALGSEVSTGFHGVKCLWRSRLSKASFTRMEISQPLTAHRLGPTAPLIPKVAFLSPPGVALRLIMIWRETESASSSATPRTEH
jgi:hypothetical protein